MATPLCYWQSVNLGLLLSDGIRYFSVKTVVYKLTPKYWRLRQPKCEDFWTKMHQNAFGGRALPGPAGELTALPQTPYAVFGEGRPPHPEREGKGKRGGEGKQGRGEKWERGERRAGEGRGKGVCPSNFYRCSPLSNSWRRPCRCRERRLNKQLNVAILRHVRVMAWPVRLSSVCDVHAPYTEFELLATFFCTNYIVQSLGTRVVCLEILEKKCTLNGRDGRGMKNCFFDQYLALFRKRYRTWP